MERTEAIAEAKRTLRKRMTLIRDQMPEAKRAEADAARWERLSQMPEYRQAEAVLTYVSVRSEADTRQMIRDALRSGKTTAVPRVQGKDMTFFVIETEADLLPAGFGLLEPSDGCPVFEFNRYETDKIILLIPGLAFDLRGGRLGYGGGYYDRFLAGHPESERIALAYEAQILCEGVPVSTVDLPMDRIVTEKGIYACRD